MALFGKNDERVGAFEETPRVSTPPSTGSAARESRSSEPADVQAHIGRGSRVQGKLSFDGSVRIEGQVEGEVEAKDTVIVGESANVVAQVVAGTIVIKGRVTGDVTARKLVELRAPGRLLGNIVTPSLVIQEGVVFEGHCSMAQADVGVERSDREKKVAIFPKEERTTARAASEIK